MSEVKIYALVMGEKEILGFRHGDEQRIGEFVKYKDYAELEAKCSALERLRTIVADPRALPRRKEWVGGQQYSYILLENVEAMVDEACRAAMLQRSEPVTDNTNQQFESLAKSE